VVPRRGKKAASTDIEAPGVTIVSDYLKNAPGTEKTKWKCWKEANQHRITVPQMSVWAVLA